MEFQHASFRPLQGILEGRLLFAIPKKGRLHAATLELLAGSDIRFSSHNRLDIVAVTNHPIALIFLPAADIPFFVDEGRVDLGITGYDQVAEYEAGTPPTDSTGVEQVMDLGFGKCSLQVQTPEQGSLSDPVSLIGRNITTSFTNLTNQYFRKLEKQQHEQASGTGADNGAPLQTKIKFASGSVESACALGVADGVIDLVESGQTMRESGLRAIDTVVESTAILIKSKHPSNPSLINIIASRIRGVITAQQYVYCSYNIRRTNLAAATKVTPGKKAPTVQSLDDQDWVAVSAMILRKESAVIMDKLSEVGADDILIFGTENTRTGGAG